MIVNSMDPIGVAVSTSPPPRFSTRGAGTAAAELFGEIEHVLCRSPQPVQSRDDESVTVLEGVERAIEVWS